jgi:integration host factor subunit beta
MTKAELIAELAAKIPHLRQADAELIVATIFDQIAEALEQGDRVELRTFGTKQRKAWTGRHPTTGDAVPVVAKAVPYFRAGRVLHSRINRRG